MPVPVRRLAVGLGAIALAVSACTPARPPVDVPDASRPRASRGPRSWPSRRASKKVDPDQRIVVTASDGQLADVTVLGPKGAAEGRASPPTAPSWTAKSSNLDFGTTYTVEATAVDPRGVSTTRTDAVPHGASPRTSSPAPCSPRGGTTVGVGMPITVTFDRQSRTRTRSSGRSSCSTPTPLEGAWSWNSDTVVQFRPKEYWPGQHRRHGRARTSRASRPSKGIYGEANESRRPSTSAPSMVTKVNAESHQAKVFRNGEKVRTIPITTGKAGFETRSGQGHRRARSARGSWTPRPAARIRTTRSTTASRCEYAMRITYSGEFLHAAPWSVGSQGYANVSHGCIGMSTTNAQWLYEHTTVGDVGRGHRHVQPAEPRQRHHRLERVLGGLARGLGHRPGADQVEGRHAGTVTGA